MATLASGKFGIIADGIGSNIALPEVNLYPQHILVRHSLLRRLSVLRQDTRTLSLGRTRIR
jgi:hypothetical protein